MVGRLLSLLVLVSLFSLSSAFSLTVIVNSNQWQDAYLGAVYAGQNDGRILILRNLADSVQKMQGLAKDEEIIILESPNFAVSRRYEEKMIVDGFTNVRTIQYTNFEDLQQALFFSSQIPRSILVLYPEFGLEAVAGAPLVVDQGFAPFFLTRNNKNFLNSLTSQKVFAGYFPVRLIDGLIGVQFFTNTPEVNAHALTAYTASRIQSDWGVLSSGDIIDLETLTISRPIVLFTGSLQETAATINQININNFEVVGSELADVATALRGASGRDLRLMLKYARTFTGNTPLRGQLFDIDYISFPVPRAEVRLDGVTYFPNLGTLGITYTNIGNVNTRVFSTIEIAGVSFSDNFIRTIPPGATVTFPYVLDAPIPQTVSSAIINTQYGYRDPLTRSLIGPTGFPVIEVEFDVNTVQPPNVAFTVESVSLEENEGYLEFVIRNSGSDAVIGFVELIQNQTTPVYSISSDVQTFNPQSITRLRVEVPRIPNEALTDREVRIITNYGFEMTAQSYETTFVVLRITRYDWVLIGVSALLLLLIVLLSVYIFKKPKSNRISVTTRSKSSVTSSKKSSKKR